MAKLLYVTTHGTDDPTRASLAIVGANGATVLVKDTIREHVHGVGFPVLSEIAATTFVNQTPIYV